MDRKAAHGFSRRDFIRIVAVGGGAAALASWRLHDAGRAHVERASAFHLGTLINLTLVGDDPHQARLAVSGVFARIAALEAVLSRFMPGSDVSALNRRGIVTNPHPELLKVLRLALDTSLSTGGAFDVTVLPLVEAYELCRSRGQGLPKSDDIEGLLPLADSRKLRLSSQAASLDAPGMGVVLDGIAKGYILDEVAGLLRDSGFPNVLVEAGGDLIALGQSSGDAPWNIGVSAPRAGMGDLLTRVDVTDRAIATSGDYLQAYSADFRHHHILDPRTGFSSPALSSATVFAPTCWQADALATAMMVMDVDEALALARRLADLDVILVTKDMRIVSSIDA